MLFITFWFDIFPDPVFKHLGIECDSCSMLPIQGKRYKCLFCPELDLSEDCHSKKRPSPCHQNHDLVDYEVIFLLILLFSSFSQNSVHKKWGHSHFSPEMNGLNPVELRKYSTYVLKAVLISTANLAVSHCGALAHMPT